MKKVAILGPSTFSEEATRHFLKDDFIYISYKLISEVFNATVAGETDLSVIPIENTLEGSVHLHVDWLVHEVNLPIRAEWVFPIDMNLIGFANKEGQDEGSNPYQHIRKVLSHHVVPAQCSRFMKKYLSGAEFEQVSSTAEGVRLVSALQDPAVAAIGTAIASTNYGVPMLEKEIQDHKDNMTRFLLVGEEAPELPTSADRKTTILVTLPEDYPGALHQVLSAFAWRRINLSKIESKPTKKKLGTYYFYIDIADSLDSVLLPSAIQEIEAIGCQVRILGSYPSYSYIS
ncbi:prephenate dehydratase [Paenibacillus marchantiophytorum]|uniref:Prephenate dehydratase n=1 Tax=Paenibacillus marchantiophytorum TaxID=1619310 RepID=A0ABQ1EU52_9BACL|nr:prephenate dehydratase [Paenibacillus marchantiophytorum]GFZ86015.1 prephenate dehydratase [Paenibacillus marchantiophytorum]